MVVQGFYGFLCFLHVGKTANCCFEFMNCYVKETRLSHLNTMKIPRSYLFSLFKFLVRSNIR